MVIRILCVWLFFLLHNMTHNLHLRHFYKEITDNFRFFFIYLFILKCRNIFCKEKNCWIGSSMFETFICFCFKQNYTSLDGENWNETVGWKCFCFMLMMMLIMIQCDIYEIKKLFFIRFFYLSTIVLNLFRHCFAKFNGNKLISFILLFSTDPI